MFTLEDVHKFVSDFDTDFNEKVKGLSADAVLSAFREGNSEEARHSVKSLFNRAILAYPDELGIPSIRQDFSVEEGTGVLHVNVQIRNKDSQGKSISQSRYISADSPWEDILQWFRDVFVKAIEIESRKENLKEINEVVQRLNKDAKNSFEVVFVDEPTAVVSVSNEKLVLGISEPILFGYTDLMIFQDRREFDPTDLETGVISEYDVKNAQEFNERFDAVWESAKTSWMAGSVVEFLLNRSDLHKVLTNIKLKKLPSLLRGSISKNPPWLNRTQKDIRVKYDLDGVFGIVERVDGVLSVSLSPVNLETGEFVELDLVKAVQDLL